jgi:aminomethyltransferase
VFCLCESVAIEILDGREARRFWRNGDGMSESETARLSPLDARHRALGARMVPFAGWELPLQYVGIIEEHRAVRQRCGLFDISHMARLGVTGSDAASLLRRAVSFDVRRLAPGQGHYALLLQEDGGILDDLFVYRLEEGHFLVVGNAVNAARDHDSIGGLVAPGMDAKVEDVQGATAMLALQGPEARERLGRVLEREAVEAVPRRGCAELAWSGDRVFISRTGYTGEDGFEIVTSPELGGAIWDEVTALGVQPCGLGARDSLRLEAALALYGNDIDTSTSPWEAGLGWVLSLDDDDFIGKEAVLAARERGIERHLVCLAAIAPGIMRSGCAILRGDEQVGRVTSGGFSPTLGVSIAMGYVASGLASEGAQVEVDVRGRRLAARVVPRPFYRRGKAV